MLKLNNNIFIVNNVNNGLTNHCDSSSVLAKFE